MPLGRRGRLPPTTSAAHPVAPPKKALRVPLQRTAARQALAARHPASAPAVADAPGRTSASAMPAARPLARNSAPSTTPSLLTASPATRSSARRSAPACGFAPSSRRRCVRRGRSRGTPHTAGAFTLYEMKRLGRDAAELTALADHLTAHGLVLEMLTGPLPGTYDPTGAADADSSARWSMPPHGYRSRARTTRVSPSGHPSSSRASRARSPMADGSST